MRFSLFYFEFFFRSMLPPLLFFIVSPPLTHTHTHTSFPPPLLFSFVPPPHANTHLLPSPSRMPWIATPIYIYVPTQQHLLATLLYSYPPTPSPGQHPLAYYRQKTNTSGTPPSIPPACSTWAIWRRSRPICRLYAWCGATSRVS